MDNQYMLSLLDGINGRLAAREQIILGIDGHCGAGKTTLAEYLQRTYGCAVIHMDDFFLPTALRTQQRLQEPGGNIHYERFLKQVAEKVRKGEPPLYQQYDCKEGGFRSEPIKADMGALLVVEGAYSLHPMYVDIYTLRVFLTLPEEEQQRRLRGRESAQSFLRFMEQWIPMENRYFEAYAIQAGCDYVIESICAKYPL